MARPLSKEKGYNPQKCGRPKKYDHLSTAHYSLLQERDSDGNIREIQVPKPRKL